jgi:hypothetical protein
MLTGELRSQVDALWNAFWSGGIANPIKVIEQITYLNQPSIGAWLEHNATGVTMPNLNTTIVRALLVALR